MPQCSTSQSQNKKAKSNSPEESSTNTFLIVKSEEAARRARLGPGDRQEEATSAQKAYDKKHQQDWSDWDGSSGSRLCSQTKRSKMPKVRPTKTKSGVSSASRFLKAPPMNSNQSLKPEKLKRRQKTQAQKAERSQKRQAEREARRQRAAQEARAARSHYDYLSKLQRTRARDDYEKLHQQRKDFHADFRSKPFPIIPRYECNRKDCMYGELLGCCHHDLQMALTGSGEYSDSFLKKEQVY